MQLLDFGSRQEPGSERSDSRSILLHFFFLHKSGFCATLCKKLDLAGSLCYSGSRRRSIPFLFPSPDHVLPAVLHGINTLDVRGFHFVRANIEGTGSLTLLPVCLE
jgi:hypothetical protein